MKEKILNNLSLKIISVVVACIIWLFVVNENDPIITKVYSVKVSIKNDDYLDEMDKTYQIPDDDRTVTVYVKGKKSVVSNRTDLEVEADLTQIVDLSTDPTYVPVKMKSAPGLSMDDVTIFPQTIPVYIEDVAEKEFVVTVTTSGTPGAGYEIGECVATPNMVTIQGPDSIVNTIKSVVANVDVTGITRDRERREVLTMIDENGERLTSDAVSLLKIFNGSEMDTVTVAVKLWRIVDNVKVIAKYTGSPADNYQVDKIVTTPETISVAGSEEALAWLKDNNNTIEIPAEMINIEGASEDIETNIKLSAILKEEDGFKIPSELTQSVFVRVNILPYGSREYSVNAADIEVEGLSSDLRMSFIQSKISLRVKGNQTYLNYLSQDSKKIKVSIDLSDLQAGQYTVPLDVTLPVGCKLIENASVIVLLSEIEQ